MQQCSCLHKIYIRNNTEYLIDPQGLESTICTTFMMEYEECFTAETRYRTAPTAMFMHIRKMLHHIRCMKMRTRV